MSVNFAGFLLVGVGVHHAGMPAADRQVIEELFRGGDLPILSESCC